MAASSTVPDAWIGCMNRPLVNLVVANSETDRPRFSKYSHAELTSTEFEYDQENGANRERNGPLCGSHPKDVARSVAKEMLETACTEPYGQRNLGADLRLMAPAGNKSSLTSGPCFDVSKSVADNLTVPKLEMAHSP